MSQAIRWTPEQLASFEKKSALSAASVKRFQALGRLKPGTMNKTEAKYAGKLEAMKFAGEILWYKFEGIKLRLADNTFLTVDFFVLLASGELQAIDVKGAKAIYTDDAKAKMKIAADMYPFAFFVCFPKSGKDGGGWLIEEV